MSTPPTSTRCDDGDEISVRRATFSDYENVVNMMEVYFGFDYLPTFYHVFLQSRQHAVYVAETAADHKLVGLANYRLGEDGKTVYQLSGRVHPDFQSRGVYGLIFNKFLEDFPDVTRSAFDGILGPGAESFFAREKDNLIHNFRWNMIIYRIDTKSLLSWKQQQCTQKTLLVNLTPSIITNRLLTSVQQCMQHFAREFTPSVHATWCPTPLNSPHTPALLKHQLMIANALVTYSSSSEHGLHAVEATCPRHISALSLQYPHLLKTRRYDGHVIAYMFVYGDSLSDVIGHCREQLRHLASVVATTRDSVFLSIRFPMTIDLESVKTFFAENETLWPKGMSSAVLERKCFLVTRNNIRSQL